jgi:hypothetical protein
MSLSDAPLVFSADAGRDTLGRGPAAEALRRMLASDAEATRPHRPET